MISERTARRALSLAVGLSGIAGERSPWLLVAPGLQESALPGCWLLRDRSGVLSVLSSLKPVGPIQSDR